MSDKPTTTTLVAPDGTRYDVPPTGVESLRAKGFRDLNDSEKNDLALQKKYGEGALPAIGAAVSGAASTATFGGSDVALAQTPFAEANRESVARNPGAHTAGQVLALTAPVLGEFAGAGLAAKGAKAAGSAITGVSKGATALGEVAGKVATKVGAPGAASIVKGATQAAAENVAFQVGSNIGTAARRNEKLDAETILAHTGEAAFLGGGLGAAIPAAGKIAKWSADKAINKLESATQKLREAGFGAANAGVDAVGAAAGSVARNADAIGAGVEGAVRTGASAVGKAADVVAGQADNIGAGLEGLANKATGFVDDKVMPKIREGLINQTDRPDVINEVFASTPEARAARQELGNQTLTGTREAQSEKAGQALNEIWSQSLEHGPMFDDLGLAVKKDLQQSTLNASGMTKQAQSAVVRDIIKEANTTLEQLKKFNPTAHTFFDDALKDFAQHALTKPTAESLYTGLDRLKVATDKISKFGQGAALGDTGAAFAAEEARRFRTFAKSTLEDTNVWGQAGAIQHEVNAAYTKYRRAFDAFEKQFATAKAKGQAIRTLDGQKIAKWSRDINGQAGQVRNAVVDDLVTAQRDLIDLTDRLSKRSMQQARETLGSSTATEAQKLRAAEVEASPDGVAGVLNRSRGAIDNLAATKASAAKAIDQAEVLQQTQNAILSRQGAGVNPLPVELAQRIGGGALVGGAIGGLPGAIVGGGITSVLQKYGAITTNPKTAIQFLNQVDKLRGVQKEQIAEWIKATLASTSRGAEGLASKVDGKFIGSKVRSGAEKVSASLPGVRSKIAGANESTAKKILEARGAALRGVENMATRLDRATPGVMERLLPTVAYSSVTDSNPQEWWARTQKALIKAQANPDASIAAIAKSLEGLADVLPGTSQAIINQQMTVLGYLVDNMPRNPRPYMIGDKPWTPSPGELKDFRDLVLVATKPDVLLPLVTLGTASRAQVDAVKQLWPAKYEDMRLQIVKAVTDASAEGHPVPYQSRLRIGQLIGTPLDASQEPGFAKWIQSIGSQTPADGKEQAPKSVGMSLNLHSETGLPKSAQLSQRH